MRGQLLIITLTLLRIATYLLMHLHCYYPVCLMLLYFCRKLNSYLIVYLVYMFVECLISTILRYWSLNTYWVEDDGTRGQWYIPFQYDYGDDKTSADVTVSNPVVKVLRLLTGVEGSVCGVQLVLV